MLDHKSAKTVTHLQKLLQILLDKNLITKIQKLPTKPFIEVFWANVKNVQQDQENMKKI